MSGLMLGTKSVGFFWDIENCPVPKGRAAFGVINRVRRLLLNRRDHREFEFTVACDVTKLISSIQDDVHRAGGVTLSHVSSTFKNAADEKLREAMKRFVDTHGGSSVLVLISGDIDFVNDLRGYQNRQGVNVILLHGKNASKYFIQGQWNEVHAFDDFCIPDEASSSVDAKRGSSTGSKDQGLKAKNEVDNSQSKNKKRGKVKSTSPEQLAPPKQSAAGSSRSLGVGTSASVPTTEKEIILMVSGLPGSVHYSVIRPELQKVADSAKGKVKFVNNGQGWITFKNRNDVGKATALFVKREILGKVLKVSEVRSIPFQKSESRHGNDTDSSDDDSSGSDYDDESSDDDEDEEIILMVSGLPGTVHHGILRPQLQEHVDPLNGKVKFVNNGQGFVTFENRSDSDWAIQELSEIEFQGRDLKVVEVKKIPYPKREDDDGNMDETVKKLMAAVKNLETGYGIGKGKGGKK